MIAPVPVHCFSITILLVKHLEQKGNVTVCVSFFVGSIIKHFIGNVVKVVDFFTFKHKMKTSFRFKGMAVTVQKNGWRTLNKRRRQCINLVGSTLML